MKFQKLPRRSSRAASGRDDEYEETSGNAASGGQVVLRGVKGTFLVIGKTILTIFLIMVITGSIVASVLTVYIVNFLKNDTEFDLRNQKFNYITTLYATDGAEGEYYPLQVIRGNENNRIWADINEIPDTMRLAAIAAEDRRFMAHQGVDWKMSFRAFLGFFLGGDVVGGTAGGSTITQQTIKNISGEKDYSVERKIREIFRALALEKDYSKDDVLEVYLNTIALGNGTYGVQAASNLYFGKNVDQLDIAECAAIVAITQNPTKWELFKHEEANRERRVYIIDYMLETELANLKSQYEGETRNEFGPVTPREMTQSEYETEKAALEKKYADAKTQELVIELSSAMSTRWDTYSYFVDYVIEEVIEDLMAQRNLTKAAALELINNGGLSIYTTVDKKVQDQLDQQFIEAEKNGYDPQNSIFPDLTGYPIVGGEYLDKGKPLEGEPQCAMVIMDYEGGIKGIAGGRGEKEGDRTFNLATDGLRQTGSSIKPLSVYGPAVDLDLVTWSTITPDTPYMYNVNGKLVPADQAVRVTTSEDEEGNVVEKRTVAGTGWPVNADYGNRSFGNVTVDFALQKSLNTVAVKTLVKLTPQTSYDFVTKNFGFELNPKTDIDLAPLALGAMNGGVSVLDMTAAFAIFGNGGLYYEPHSYTKVVDAQGNVLLEANTIPRRVISADTAEVMNKLLQNVNKLGTGVRATSGINIPTFGKTGTSTLDKDQWYIGGTPYYVSGLWLGYDKENAGISYNYSTQGYPPLGIWNKVLRPLSEEMEYKDFPVSGGVVQMAYCTESGYLAGPNCLAKGTGWYKESSLPGYCTIQHGIVGTETGEGEASGDSASADEAESGTDAAADDAEATE